MIPCHWCRVEMDERLPIRTIVRYSDKKQTMVTYYICSAACEARVTEELNNIDRCQSR